MDTARGGWRLRDTAINAQSEATLGKKEDAVECGSLPCPCRGLQSDSVSDPGPTDERLESWKEIAAYLRRDVTTVQRWERREGMPVHRHLHDKAGSVHAFRSELDAWAASRAAPASADGAAPGEPVPPAPVAARHYLSRWTAAVGTGAVVIAALAGWWSLSRDRAPEDPLRDARFIQLTNFDGSEQAAALSRDGRFVAFLSDRDGRMDVWVTQIGAGRFYNITKGGAPELINPAVRTLGFSPDGTQVTFWTRAFSGSGTAAAIGIWAAPVLGGTPRPYLEGAAEFDWSPDGQRLVYHTPGAGDPMFVREAGSDVHQVFAAPAGLHAHFPVWSPDGGLIYFVQGTVPDRMDIWRLRPDGSGAERITHHDARVSHPVFVDARTLLYLTTDSDGSGPWIHAIDVERREPHRVSPGLERYTSLAAGADGRSLAATRTDIKTTLWRVAVDRDRVAATDPQRIPLAAGTGRSPKLGPGYLVYVSASADGDTVWKQQAQAATELWRSPQARIIGAPAIAHSGTRIAFCARDGGATALFVMNADGTDTRVLTRSLALQGTPAWSPDEQSITVSAIVNGAPRLVNVPLDGTAAVPLVEDHATDPVWSPDGALVVYSGADIGTTFPVKAHYPAGRAGKAFPAVMLSRGSRHLAFLPGGRSLLMLRGEIGHKNLWIVDLETGAERQLTSLPPEFIVHDFAISPDGRELVLERLQERSDIVLIQRGK
jgi:Tol biopolymer transport system component